VIPYDYNGVENFLFPNDTADFTMFSTTHCSHVHDDASVNKPIVYKNVAYIIMYPA
jgi:hypothetical protein